MRRACWQAFTSTGQPAGPCAARATDEAAAGAPASSTQSAMMARAAGRARFMAAAARGPNPIPRRKPAMWRRLSLLLLLAAVALACPPLRPAAVGAAPAVRIAIIRGGDLYLLDATTGAE